MKYSTSSTHIYWSSILHTTYYIIHIYYIIDRYIPGIDNIITGIFYSEDKNIITKKTGKI